MEEQQTTPLINIIEIPADADEYPPRPPRPQPPAEPEYLSNHDVHLQGLTFVTCYVNIYQNEPFQHKNAPWRIEQFEFIASQGVNMVVYGDDATMPYLEASVAKYPNAVILHMDTPYQETPIYKMCGDPTLRMPDRRLPAKDTFEYMALMHAKIEFMYDAIKKNPWKSKYFAWMDFSMAYLFGNKGYSLEQLRLMAFNCNFKEPIMAVPGCWLPIPPNNASAIVNNIHWRFCGSFFLGDVHSILRFHRIYREHYPRFLETEGRLVWEVNVWAWLEANTDWRPDWYASDHNDRIIQMPAEFYNATQQHQQEQTTISAYE